MGTYPYKDDYRTWPGPNSNTFLAHVAREVPELSLDIPASAIGKDYRPWYRPIGYAPSGTGVQISILGLLGATVAAEEGIEFNVLGLAFGVDFLRPALRLPAIGRLGQRIVGLGHPVGAFLGALIFTLIDTFAATIYDRDRFNTLNSNPVIEIKHFAYPAAFTPGNSGRNILGGTPKIAMDASAQKNVPLTEKLVFQIRLDIHSVQKMVFNKYNFNAPSTTVDLTNPRTFGKVTGGPTTIESSTIASNRNNTAGGAANHRRAAGTANTLA